MEPKFQSSFIPKGPLAATTTGPNLAKRPGEKSILGLFGLVLFIVSVLGAAGVFGYKYYLKSNIEAMQADLEEVRAALNAEEIKELTHLHNRIVTTRELISKHVVLSPFFEFLETSAPRLVRFSELMYRTTAEGIEVNLRGESRGYGALALQANIFDQNNYFKSPAFSNLLLNERGDVTFSFRGLLDPGLISYAKLVESGAVPPSLPSVPEPVPGLDTI